MRSLQLTLAFVLPAALFACNTPVDPDPLGNAGSAGNGGGSSSSTSSSSSGMAGAGGDGGGVPQGTAQVRFMNPGSAGPTDFHSENLNGDPPKSEMVSTASGTKYLDHLAGSYNFFTTNADGEVARIDSQLVAAEKQYTVAGLGLNGGTPMMIFKQDDYTNIAADHTRFNFINAHPADPNVELEVFVLYPNPDMTETVKANFKGKYGSINTEDLAFAATPVHLELYWPLPNSATRKVAVTWNIASFVQQNKNSAVDVYVNYSGQCDNSQPAYDCHPDFLAQGVSGSVGGAILVSVANTP